MRYLIAVLLLLLGCSKTPDTPKWYLNTPKDSPLYLYGSGAGESKQDAINNALSFMASKLKVKIDSTFKSEKSLIQTNDDTNVYKNLSQNIKTTVDNFTFYNYQIDKIKKIDDKYYVLLKINRIKNAQKIVDSIKEQLNGLPSSTTPIENVKNYKNAIKKLKELKNQYKLAKILDPSVEEIDLDSKIKEYSSKLQNITFNVNSNDEFIKNMTLTYLSQKGFSISKNPKIKIKLNLKTSTKRIVGEYLTNASLDATISDLSASKSYHIQCAANSFSKTLSKKLAIKKCSQKLNSILNTLFD